MLVESVIATNEKKEPAAAAAAPANSTGT